MTQTGIVKTITFHNPDTGYSVIRLSEPETEKIFTAVGSFPKLGIGEQLELEGSWVEHPSYGRQFKSSDFKVVPPETASAMELYLSSGLFKGVGPVQAKKLVDVFGTKTFDVLDNEPERLSEIKGLTPSKQRNLIIQWQEKKQFKEVLFFLQSHDLSVQLSTKIFKTYGNQAIHIIKQNPYKLAEDIWGVGFIKADQIAIKLGFDLESYDRIKAGLRYALNKSVEEGHVYLTTEELVQRTAQLLNCPPEIIVYTMDNLVEITDIKKSKEGNFYLPYLYHSEKGIAQKIWELLDSPNLGPSPSNLREYVQKAKDQLSQQLGYSFDFNQGQLQAIEKATHSKVFILTGGPGTGKTTTLMGILKIFQGQSLNIKVTAPTGRAAKRLTEVTQFQAATIHRLLQFDPENSGFLHQESNPLKADVIVVDEVSMVDTSLMYSLLRALSKSTRLILVGDKNQLPSVGPGKVLSELIESKSIAHEELREITRQDSESQIVQWAHNIHNGKKPLLEPPGPEVFFAPCQTSEKVLSSLKKLIEELPNKFSLHPSEEVQILTPMNKGPLGTEIINNLAQQLLNPTPRELVFKNIKFKAGDKVMQLRNNYEKNVFNGDIGYIQSIDFSDKKVKVRFDSVVVYEWDELEELNLAYATTIHKSQGSEYKAIILILTHHHRIMLQRNLLYTAITRAREKAFILGQANAIYRAVENNPTVNRNTLLANKLQAGQKDLEELPF